MTDSTARYIKIHDFALCPARIRGRPPTEVRPNDLQPLLAAVQRATHERQPLGDQADAAGRRLYLMDMTIWPRDLGVAFVWTLADPRAAAQMYLSRRDASLRPASKARDEDVAISAHFIVDLKSEPNVWRYQAALEDVEAISRTRISDLLQQLLRDHMPPVTATIVDGVEKSGLPTVLMDAHQGRILGNTDAKPIEIELVKQIPRRQMTMEAADYFREVSERRVFKLVRDGTVPQLREAVLVLARELRVSFPEHRIRIRWDDPDRANRTQEVTQIDPLQQPEQLLQRATTRTEYLDGFRDLPDATDTVVDRLAQRMLQRLREVGAEERRR